MSSKIRVLLADDSFVVRRLLTQALARHADLEVVGIARNGAEVLQLLPTAAPDVVLLDVEMPELNGVQTAGQIRQRFGSVPIIMFSSLTVRGGEATLDALANGANDYVAKPRQTVSLAASLDLIDSELVTKIRYWGAVQRKETVVPPAESTPVVRELAPPSQVRAIVIGASTGGPNALATVLPQFPAQFPVPILIVQHMPPVFTELLALRLNHLCRCPVREAVDGERIEPGTILIAPGNRHLKIRQNGLQEVVSLDDGPQVQSCRPAVDVLFTSAAEVYGAGVIAAVLTGMGRDGQDGAAVVKSRGGLVLAQDRESCVVWGMPRAVTEAGHAAAQVPLMSIGQELARLAVGLSRRPSRRVPCIL